MQNQHFLSCFMCGHEFRDGETYYHDQVSTAGHPFCESCTLDALMDQVDVDELADACGWVKTEYHIASVKKPAPEPIPVLPGQIDMWGNEH